MFKDLGQNCQGLQHFNNMHNDVQIDSMGGSTQKLVNSKDIGKHDALPYPNKYVPPFTCKYFQVSKILVIFKFHHNAKFCTKENVNLNNEVNIGLLKFQVHRSSWLQIL